MSTIPDLSKVPILPRQSNYAAWSLETQGVAMLGGFWDAFTGENDTILQDPAIDAATKRACNIVEQKAHGLIIKTISQVLRQEIHDYKVVTTAATSNTAAVTRTAKAKDLWKYLESKFKVKDVGKSPWFSNLEP